MHRMSTSVSYMHICSCTCLLPVVDTNQYIAIQASPAAPLPTRDVELLHITDTPPSPTTPRAAVSDDDRPIGGGIPTGSTTAAPTTPGILDAVDIGGSRVRSAKRGRSPVVKFELKSPVCAPLDLSDTD